MTRSGLCSGSCEHARSFRYGFGGGMIVAPYGGRDKAAACALRKDGKVFVVGVSACWRGVKHE